MKQFLYIPLAASCDFKITEGWFYSAEERRIHGFEEHRAIDFAAKRGTPVLAAASGYAVASYHAGYAGEYEGKRVGYGLGRFVQIWHPGANVYTVYAHLEKTSKDIPFLEPVRSDGGWESPDALKPIQEILWHSKFVVRGEEVGKMGDSGLSWGYDEGPDFRPDPAEFPSWDEVHLHFAVNGRDEAGRKGGEVDPFGIYRDFRAYQDLSPGKGGLWILSGEGRPRFASKA